MNSNDANGAGGGPRKGDQYAHDTGVTEVVYMRDDGRVLTFREYPDVDAFEEAVVGAAYRGINEDVAALPDAAAFADVEPDDVGAGDADDGVSSDGPAEEGDDGTDP